MIENNKDATQSATHPIVSAIHHQVMEGPNQNDQQKISIMAITS
jgi:hypothetical protein